MDRCRSGPSAPETKIQTCLRERYYEYYDYMKRFTSIILVRSNKLSIKQRTRFIHVPSTENFIENRLYLCELFNA